MLSLSAKVCARQKTEFRDCFYFLQDLEYWNVDELYLEQCCVQKYYQQRELLTWDMGTTKKEDELEIFRAGRLGRLQKILWDLFERPHTSIGARVMIYYYFVSNSSDNFMNSVTTNLQVFSTKMNVAIYI